MWECVGRMHAVPHTPRLHLFVCVNERAPGDPLGEGCGARGQRVYERLKDEVRQHGDVQTVWVTRTHCLGVCPAEGCTVAVWPRGNVFRDVVASDAPALLDTSDDGLGALEDLQREKVLSLSRRLKPGLTLEDVKNPHDFPELDDCDWHYEDGVLTGIQAVRTALRAGPARVNR
jgi:(2Fe-2S) ferredoxin